MTVSLHCVEIPTYLFNFENIILNYSQFICFQSIKLKALQGQATTLEGNHIQFIILMVFTFHSLI